MGVSTNPKKASAIRNFNPHKEERAKKAFRDRTNSRLMLWGFKPHPTADENE